MKQIFTFLAAVVLTASTFAQVGIGTTIPNPSAALDITSTTQGFLPPRMTAAQRNSISNPPAGLMLWCSDCGSNGELQVFNGTTFTNVTGGERERATSLNAQIGSDIDGEEVNDISGSSVSLSSDGTIVAIGARYNDGNGSSSGHVRVYQYASSTWSQLGSDIDGEAANDISGYSVSLSSDGTIVAIGAIYNDGSTGSDAGHVRVYKNISGTWTKIGDDIDGEAANDNSGFSVSLSSDGTIVAIGAPQNVGTGSNAGHVRVYQYASSTWSQLESDIDGEAANDISGSSVSLSSDGTIVAIGAPQNDGNGSNSGHVRVYGEGL